MLLCCCLMSYRYHKHYNKYIRSDFFSVSLKMQAQIIHCFKKKFNDNWLKLRSLCNLSEYPINFLCFYVTRCKIYFETFLYFKIIAKNMTKACIAFVMPNFAILLDTHKNTQDPLCTYTRVAFGLLWVLCCHFNEKVWRFPVYF